jgi:hypothetical protein
MCTIIATERAIPWYLNPLARHLCHRETLPTSSLAHKGQDCGNRHDILEVLVELVDNIVSELGLHDSDE